MDRQREAVRREARALITRPAGELLIIRRYADDECGWELPGGPVAPHADAWTELQRQCVEQVGLDLAPLRELAPVPIGAGGATIEYRVFVAEAAADEALALGCAEVRWVRRERVALYAFEPSLARLLATLLDVLP
jgi:ADP-ribose pyrophosphatase YjhB (NUDIX family)